MTRRLLGPHDTLDFVWLFKRLNNNYNNYEHDFNNYHARVIKMVGASEGTGSTFRVISIFGDHIVS